MSIRDLHSLCVTTKPWIVYCLHTNFHHLLHPWAQKLGTTGFFLIKSEGLFLWLAATAVWQVFRANAKSLGNWWHTNLNFYRSYKDVWMNRVLPAENVLEQFKGMVTFLTGVFLWTEEILSSLEPSFSLRNHRGRKWWRRRKSKKAREVGSSWHTSTSWTWCRTPGSLIGTLGSDHTSLWPCCEE